MQETTKVRTCKEAGWHISRYLVFAQIPESESFGVMSLYQGSFTVLSKTEAMMLSIAEELDEDHPGLEKLKKFGFIVNFDEKEALNASARIRCSGSGGVRLTICPTMGCNFDCPYCFENHRAGRMSQETQDAVVTLAQKMMDTYGEKNLSVTWFGGEPLLAPDIIEALTLRLRPMAEARGGHYSAIIITNGYLLNEKNIALLERCDVRIAQVTLDGLGEVHDRTRHLAGGGATFERIVSNLTENKMSFLVKLRHNVYAENLDQVEPLKAYVEKMARESGNNIHYYTALVSANTVMEERGNLVDRLEDEERARELTLRQEANRYSAKQGTYCMANHLAAIGIDDMGRLYKCWENVDKPETSFGDVMTWDPVNPIRTAEIPDNMTRYLNTCCPCPTPECEDCLWLPMCCGGCPRRRLDGEDVCFSFKDDPEAFCLAVYKSLGERGQKRRESEDLQC